MGALWLSGRVLDSRQRCCWFKPHHCPLARNINTCIVLVQPRKTCPGITEKLLTGKQTSGLHIFTLCNDVQFNVAYIKVFTPKM